MYSIHAYARIADLSDKVFIISILASVGSGPPFFVLLHANHDERFFDLLHANLHERFIDLLHANLHERFIDLSMHTTMNASTSSHTPLRCPPPQRFTTMIHRPPPTLVPHAIYAPPPSGIL
ncbi:hypothetical protein T492DRAFT_1131836 [Pavlovales sp. CCMP2436]|nr:hypothetical protein T492DRAFT_1131836 [Pavlovales sp. CCMP2436]